MESIITHSCKAAAFGKGHFFKHTAIAECVIAYTLYRCRYCERLYAVLTAEGVVGNGYESFGDYIDASLVCHGSVCHNYFCSCRIEQQGGSGRIGAVAVVAVCY